MDRVRDGERKILWRPKKYIYSFSNLIQKTFALSNYYVLSPAIGTTDRTTNSQSWSSQPYTENKESDGFPMPTISFLSLKM